MKKLLIIIAVLACGCYLSVFEADGKISNLFEGFVNCSISTPCQNNGTCYDEINGTYWCECLVGYHGDNCEKDACIDYVLLDPRDRSVNVTVESGSEGCDDRLEENWYRLVSPAGYSAEVLTGCADNWRCGTKNPASINASLPDRVGEGFNMTGCITVGGQCCALKTYIEVKICELANNATVYDKYGVYHLTPTQCPIRYCSQETTWTCPQGYWSATGYVPCINETLLATESPPPPPSSPNIGVIIGAVVGSLCAVLLLVALIVGVLKKKQAQISPS